MSEIKTSKKDQRQIVFNKYGGKCAYCGINLTKGWHVDHIEPVKRQYKYVDKSVVKKRYDGSEYTSTNQVLRYDKMLHPHLDTIENSIPACAKCNINKHESTIEEFRNHISGYLNSLNKRMVQYQMVKKYGLVQETNNPVVFYFETLAHNHFTKNKKEEG